MFRDEPSNAALPAEFSKDMDVETYLDNAPVELTIYVNIEVGTREIDAEKLWIFEAMRGYSMSVRVYYFSQEDFESEITQENRNYQELPHLCFADFILFRNRAEYKPVSWRARETLSELAK